MSKKDMARVSDEERLLKELGIDNWSDDTVEEEKKASEAATPPGFFFGAFKEGRTQFRVGPPRAGARSPFKPVQRHFADLPSGDTVNWLCPRMAGRRCKDCEKGERLLASPNQLDQKQGKRMLASSRVMFNALNRKFDQKRWQLAEVAKGTYDDMLEKRDRSGLGANFVHPFTGMDIVIMRKGSRQNDTEYTVALDPRGASPILPGATTEQLRAFLSGLIDLEAEATPFSDAEIEAIKRGEKVERVRPDNRAIEARSTAAPSRPDHDALPAGARQRIDEEAFAASNVDGDDDIPF